MEGGAGSIPTLVAVEASSSSSFPTEGISMHGIRAFIEDNGGRGAFEGKTTSEIVRAFLLPATVAEEESWVKLHLDNREWVGNASIFVSHAWSGRFLELIDSLADWEATTGERHFFWIDMFINNQHKTDKPPTWWKGVFRTNVSSIGRTLLVLDFQRAIPLSRSWCIFEILCSCEGGSESGAPVTASASSSSGPGHDSLTIIMSAKEAAHFTHELVADAEAIIRRVTSIDVRRAKAYHGNECGCAAAGRACPNDQQMILDTVEESLGAATVNDRVATAMRTWMAKTGGAVLAGIADPDERASSELQLAYAHLLHWHQGRTPEAEALYVAAIEARTRAYGKFDVKTAAAQQAYGDLLLHLTRTEEALSMYAAVLAARTAALGSDHADTLFTASAYASALHQAGKLEESVAFFKEVQARARAALGDDHPTLITSLHYYSLPLVELKRYEEAEVAARAVVAARLKQYAAPEDAEAPELLQAYNNLGRIRLTRDDPTEAVKYLQLAADGRKRAFGASHPATLHSVEWLQKAKDALAACAASATS